jgi:hypothetical protein
MPSSCSIHCRHDAAIASSSSRLLSPYSTACSANDEETTRSAHSSPHHRLDFGSANVHVELLGWMSVKPAVCAQPVGQMLEHLVGVDDIE